MQRYIIGIDIGGTNTKYGIFDCDGKLITKEETPTGKKSYQETIKNISEKIKNTCQKNHISTENILGIGVGLPGPVKDNIVRGCVNLGWPKFNIELELAKYFPNIKIKSGNDANLAALGEYIFGTAQNEQTLLFVTLGTGIGGGIIIEGKLLEGFNGSAAEIGHLPLPYIPEYHDILSEYRDYDLEKIASANGLANCARILLSHSSEQSLLCQNKELSAKDIMAAAKNNDTLAEMSVSMCAKYLAYGLASVANTINPSSILIGGGLSASGDYYFDQVREYYKNIVFHPNRDVRIITSTLGNDAGICGAVGLFMEKGSRSSLTTQCGF